MEKIGNIYSDAGMCWLGDPCYLRGDEGRRYAKPFFEDWSAFCKLVDNSKNHQTFGFDPAKDHEGEGMGVVVSTGYGDGSYPVYVTRKDGRIASVTVQFIREEKETTEEDE